MLHPSSHLPVLDGMPVHHLALVHRGMLLAAASLVAAQGRRAALSTLPILRGCLSALDQAEHRVVLLVSGAHDGPIRAHRSLT